MAWSKDRGDETACSIDYHLSLPVFATSGWAMAYISSSKRVYQWQKKVRSLARTFSKPSTRFEKGAASQFQINPR
mgnify:CR=1 FL=1